MKITKIILSILVLTICGTYFVSCDANTYSDITVSVANPTYTANIAPLMVSNCTGCHSAGAQSPPLETFAEVKAATNTGNVICRMENTCGAIMPPSGAMAASTINMIKLWKTQGFVQ